MVYAYICAIKNATLINKSIFLIMNHETTCCFFYVAHIETNALMSKKGFDQPWLSFFKTYESHVYLHTLSSDQDLDKLSPTT